MLSTSLTVLICVAFICATVNGQAPTVTIKQTDPMSQDDFIQAYRDTDVVMDCYVENLPVATTVRWQRTYSSGNGTWMVLSLSQDMALEDNIHFSIERPTQFTWRLRIRAIQTSDDGIYQCFVLTTLNSRAKDERKIIVVVPPSLDLQQTSSDMTVTAGENVDLKCNATGRPAPVIEFTRLGGALLPIGQEKLMGSLLHIENVQAEDRGVYRCIALNSVGQDQTDIVLNVRFAPILTAPRDVVYQAVGYRVELQCYGEANPIPLTEHATWVFGSTTYTMSSEGYEVRFVRGAFGRVSYELIIFCLEERHYGDYTCRMKNAVGSTRTTITLARSDKPEPSVKLGQTIPCSAPGRALMSTALLVAASFISVLLRTDNGL